MLLIGDVGGTKTNLAIFSIEDGHPKLEMQSTFVSASYTGLEAIAQKFLADTGVQVQAAVVGVAGPVVHGQCKTTNLPWLITETGLGETLNLSKVKLLNDLESTANAVPYLQSHELEILNRSDLEIKPNGHKAVVAPGTGLGEAILFHHRDHYHVIPSEGGHASFAPTNALQIGLLSYMLRNFNHVSYERVCSGSMGIPNIYTYLKETRYSEMNPDVAKAVSEASDMSPVIVKAAMAGECQLCIATLNTFVSILGSEASNLAVKVVSSGGVYLGGGIPPKILPKLKDGTFMAAFVNKGRFAKMLSQMPVYVILNDKAALLGAAYYGLKLLAN